MARVNRVNYEFRRYQLVSLAVQFSLGFNRAPVN